MKLAVGGRVMHALAQAKDRDEPGQFRFLRAIATGGWQSIEAASDPPQRSDLDHDHPRHRGWHTCPDAHSVGIPDKL